MPFATDRERPKSIVFIIDDDASMREALSSLMCAIGWQVQTFETAAEFLAHTRPNLPACLVLDVRLPVTSGLDLQRILAERGDALPIVFMTSRATALRAAARQLSWRFKNQCPPEAQLPTLRVCRAPTP